MPTITIDPELFKRLPTSRRGVHPEIVVDEAVRRYLWELDREQINKDTQAYRRQYPRLKELYGGEYIAMRDSQVVDHDPDFAALRQRVYQEYGNLPVMIPLVGDQPDIEFSRHGFRVE